MTNSVCSLCLGTGKVFHENPPRKDTPYSRCHCQVVAVSQPDEVRSVDALGTEIAKLMDVHGIKPPLPPKFWLALEKLLSGGVAQAVRDPWANAIDPDARTPGDDLGPSELIRIELRQAMLDCWNSICADTDCHPLDIKHQGKKLFFTPDHWADMVAWELSCRLSHHASMRVPAQASGQCRHPHLGLATTRELLAEISARIEIHAAGGLDYRTVGGEEIVSRGLSVPSAHREGEA